jgi:hypothetical protein
MTLQLTSITYNDIATIYYNVTLELLQYIRYNVNVKEVKIIRYHNLIPVPGKENTICRLIRKFPKDKWNDILEYKLNNLSDSYKDNHNQKCFWISAMNTISTDTQNKLSMDLHLYKSLNINEYLEICLCEKINDVIDDDAFIDTIQKYLIF